MVKSDIYFAFFSDININNLLFIEEFKSIINNAYQDNPILFSQEYRSLLDEFYKTRTNNSITNLVQNSFILLRFIITNVTFDLGISLLSESLNRLSENIQLLETVYKDTKYENIYGIVVAYKIDRMICDMFYGTESDIINNVNEMSSVWVKTIKQIPITNTTLASWSYIISKHYGIKVDNKTKNVIKTLYVFDNLLGSGITDLLMNCSKDKTEKKLKVFCMVGLDSLYNDILDFYSYRTGNEKKRALNNIKGIVDKTDIIDVMNKYLKDNTN